MIYYGFLGVDIFLLLSGYGLSNSFSKNKLGTFYQHRVVRIAPLFLLMMLAITIIDVLIGQKSFTVFNLIANITTLSYLGLGGWFIEWYLCVLLYLCVLFPLFYKLLSAVRSDWGGDLFYSIIVVTIVILTVPLEWYYKCAIGRIPIFCAGIMLYQKKINVIQIIRAYTIGLTIAVALFLLHKVETFCVMYMLAPFAMLIISRCCHGFETELNSFRKRIETIGAYTLEIYVANVIVLKLVHDFAYEGLKLPVYFVLQVILSFVIIRINKMIDKL